jgi:NADPH:quinone reductase-like Zn-dependent oxidoreductase
LRQAGHPAAWNNDSSDLAMNMKALVYTEHGPPELLRLAELEIPVPKEHEVLVRVRAASVNPLDWHLLRGEPYLLRLMGRGAKKRIPGLDVAGQVDKVGANVAHLRPGDAVLGTGRGAFAEYVCCKEDSLVPKPTVITYEQAAAIPVAGCTALEALRDHGELQSGQRVLINGAAGGVGTFAVQIARALGADVTAVCSTRNVDLLRSIGARHVIDYTAEDFTRTGQPYDLVLNIAGNRSIRDLRRALTPEGTLVIVGGGTGRQEQGGAGMLAALALSVGSRLFSRFVRQQIRMFIAKGRKDDLLFLSQLIESGKLTPIIDRTYPLTDAAAAFRYLEAGHARGKVVIAT